MRTNTSKKSETIANADDWSRDFLMEPDITMVSVDREKFSLSNCIFSFKKKSSK
jgi:hypothetical protein